MLAHVQSGWLCLYDAHLATLRGLTNSAVIKIISNYEHYEQLPLRRRCKDVGKFVSDIVLEVSLRVPCKHWPCEIECK